MKIHTTRKALALSFVVGAATMAAIMWGWSRWRTAGPHTHVYGQWRAGSGYAFRTGVLPSNERRCLRCGWREIRLAGNEEAAE